MKYIQLTLMIKASVECHCPLLRKRHEDMQEMCMITQFYLGIIRMYVFSFTIRPL
jgi:hypothetical protein